MSELSTPIRRNDNEEELSTPIHTMPSHPLPPPPMLVPVPPPPSSGPIENFKEFFNVRNFDFKYVIIVFALLLIASSSTLSGLISSNAGSETHFVVDGKPSLLTSVIIAIIGSVIFVLLALLINKFSV